MLLSPPLFFSSWIYIFFSFNILQTLCAVCSYGPVQNRSLSHLVPSLVISHASPHTYTTYCHTHTHSKRTHTPLPLSFRVPTQPHTIDTHTQSEQLKWRQLPPPSTIHHPPSNTGNGSIEGRISISKWGNMTTFNDLPTSAIERTRACILPAPPVACMHDARKNLDKGMNYQKTTKGVLDTFF
ncbi:MAG: hypothetical protein J3Q66DRAFT_45455 [Benniella sp.]|nr:MAG: hypothetical protein J3Q66DRAFT_45455 [Benniella sp.]